MKNMAAPANFIRFDHLNYMRLVRRWPSLGLGKGIDHHIFNHLCATVDYQKKYCFDADLNRVVNQGYLSEILGHARRYVRLSLMRLEAAGVIVVLRYHDSMNLIVHPYIAASGDVFDEHLRLFPALTFLTRPAELVVKSGIIIKVPERWNWQTESQRRKWNEGRKSTKRAIDSDSSVANSQEGDLPLAPKVLISGYTLGDSAINTVGDSAFNTVGDNKHIRDNIQESNIQESNIERDHDDSNDHDLERKKNEQGREKTFEPNSPDRSLSSSSLSDRILTGSIDSENDRNDRRNKEIENEETDVRQKDQKNIDRSMGGGSAAPADNRTVAAILTEFIEDFGPLNLENYTEILLSIDLSLVEDDELFRRVALRCRASLAHGLKEAGKSELAHRLHRKLVEAYKARFDREPLWGDDVF